MSKNKNLANNIMKLRKQKGLSQEKLARLSDVANNTIIKMESGENDNPTSGNTTLRIRKGHRGRDCQDL